MKKEQSAPGTKKVSQNQFIIKLNEALQQASKDDLSKLKEIFEMGEFAYYTQDIPLFLYLAATAGEGRTFTYGEIVSATRRHNGEDLPGIMAGLTSLENKGLIRVTWGHKGLKEAQPFHIAMSYQPDDFRAFLEEINKASRYASLKDLERLKILFQDHPELRQDFFKFALLVYLMQKDNEAFTLTEIIEAYHLDRKEDRAKAINALEYLHKEKLIEVQWTSPDEGFSDVSRLRKTFQFKQEENHE